MAADSASQAHVESVTSVCYATEGRLGFDGRLADMRSKKVVA
jgi:hypothetical protein